MKCDMSGHVTIRTQYAKTCRMAPIQVKSHHDLRVAKSPMRTSPGNHTRARVNVPKTENNIQNEFYGKHSDDKNIGFSLKSFYSNLHESF